MLAQALLAGACAGTAAEAENVQSTADDETAIAGGLQADADTAEEAESLQADAEEETLSPQADDARERYEDGANGFALRLTRTVLSTKEEGENMILSPYSVWLPLAALGNAADDAVCGELLSVLGKAGYDAERLNEEVKSALALLSCEEEKEWMEENGWEFESPLKIANALFLDQALKVRPEFMAAFADYYEGKLFSVDFTDDAAAEAVNEWARQQTDGRIDRIIDRFEPQTVAAIANAIYFADSWTTEFSKEATRDDTFCGTQGDSEIPFMNREFAQMPYYEDETVQITMLSTTKGGQMVLLLPKDGYTAETVLESVSLETLDRCENRTVQLSLPRFELESEAFSLRESLEMMGIPLFDGQTPSLTGLAEAEELFLSDAVQKAMICVDEDGMTAAAVTMVMMERAMAIEQEPVEMKCDHPFAFLLTADAGEQQQILFTGVVNRIG